jgi:hypothetical protein
MGAKAEKLKTETLKVRAGLVIQAGLAKARGCLDSARHDNVSAF